MTDETMTPEPSRYRKTITDAEKDKFARELALGYYEPEELRHVMKIVPEGFKALMTSEDIRVRVLKHRREIDESPDALRIHARKAARIAIEKLAELIEDKEAPAKTRMEAGRQLREYAMVADKEALADPNAGGPTIIKTNLDLVGAKGVYTITAEEIAEQVEENDKLVREIHGDDFADLLGVADGEA
jgi:hypothetical protein